MAKRIQTAIDMVEERKKAYAQSGTPFHKPWIFMITNGETTSLSKEMSDVAERINPQKNCD